MILNSASSAINTKKPEIAAFKKIMRNQTTRSSLPPKSSVDYGKGYLASIASQGDILMFDERRSSQAAENNYE